MAGHSKWSNIKRKKELNDAKRSKLFSKLVREITIAANLGGVLVEFNARLKLAIQNAKGANVSKEAIHRAINAGEGGGKETSLVEVTYEGYGHHGVAIIVCCMTDKLTRTVANIRAIFSKYGGSLEKIGSLSFLFGRKGIFTIPLDEIKNEEVCSLAFIDAGAEELAYEAACLHVMCPIEAFGDMQKQLDKLGIVPTQANLHYIPHTFVELDDEPLVKIMKLIEALEDDDDVQKVYHNVIRKNA